MNEPSNSETAKPSRRLKFSVRTMLIAVTVIAVSVAGYQFWVQSTTEYELQGTISFPMEDFNRINDKSGAASRPKRFNYIDPDAGNTEIDGYVKGHPVNGDESIMCWIGIGTITYATTANYYNKTNKIDDLETQLKKTERRKINSDLRFRRIWIGEGQRGNFKVIKEIPLDKEES